MPKNKKKENKPEGFYVETDDYRIEIKYNKKAREENLVKFIVKSGDTIEIPAGALAEVLAQISTEIASPGLVDRKVVQMIKVNRTIKGVLDRDMKKGQEININYSHMHPIEFAIAEEAERLCKIPDDIKELNKKALERAAKRVTKKQKEFIKIQNAALLQKMYDEQLKKEEEEEGEQ